mmetsp:Transcript_27662/g.39562  ORF Transcript_27662/g.39562 Transcript_27662/m.39562 type:complete len:246 (-) Transcript_27662:1698-2435(-)
MIAEAPKAQIMSRSPSSKVLDQLGDIEEVPPHIVEDRFMLSLTSADRIHITNMIVPGTREAGCLGPCCHSPDDCPHSAWLCPCGFVDYPEHALKKMNASRYVRVRENSIEWNNPSLRFAQCCSTDLEVMDNVHVMYFDDSQFSEIKANVRLCHNFRSFCCGGSGEPVDIEQTCFFGLCLRGRSTICCFLPTFCPTESLASGCCCSVPCPCWGDWMARRVLWVEDANSTAKIIKDARDHARSRLKV